MPTTDPCTLPLVAVTNENCIANPLGKQIVMVLYQETAGVAPDLTTVPATGADTRLAALQAALTATGADKVYALKNLAGTVVPASADTVLQNNDVPYGGQRITDRIRTVKGRVDFLTPASNEAMNALNDRQKPIRTWEVDEYGMVQGPFENTTLSFSNIVRSGIAGAPTHREFTKVSRGLHEPAFSAAPLAGIASIQNA